MKRIVLLGTLILAFLLQGRSQDVFNPGDPIVRYDPSKPYGSQQFPDTNRAGLQKWVSKPTIGVSLGSDVFDASSFKQYFINFNGAKMAFRIKFPKSYNNPDSSDKKYPIDLFLHGGGEVGCSTNGGIYNNEKQLWLGGNLHMQFVDQNKFDGFLVYPQLVVGGGCFFGWGTAASSNYTAILAMIDSMVKYVRADNDRLIIDGLSGGGYGAWRFAANYPKRVAKIMPSASQGTVVPADRPALVHIPIWFATGGLDPDPDTIKAKNVYTRFKDLGADIRYTMFPERGHSCWYQHWREPDYVPSMNDVHKANPLVFFQRSEFCNEADVNAKIGITGGFYAYEWQRNNVTVATSTNNMNLLLDPVRITGFTGNEMTVKAYGVYRVRFKRTASSEWSDWSRKPAEIKTKTGTQTAPIMVNGKRSKVVPALDGSTIAPLTLAPGFIHYEWFRVDNNQQVSSSQIYDAPVGVYKARYAEEFGCGTDFSPEFTVVDANGTPKPGASQNLIATPGSETVIKLKWTDGAGETGVEVYRSTAPGGPYQFVALTAANKTTFNDSNLTKNIIYYYKLRAVSETGASEASNEATAKTLVDNTPPTAPSNLIYTESSAQTAVRLTWTASTDDQEVERYDIYVNGEKLYSVPASGYTVTHLDSLKPYRFIVKAVDSSGNVSPASNQVTYLPPGTPAGYIPGLPSDVKVTAVNYNTINISWTDTSANETGFEIVRSLTTNGTYKPVATVAANDTEYSDVGLTAATTYFYRVRSIGNNGESEFSDKVNAKTLATPATPVSPTYLTGEGGSNTISLSWTDNSGNETNFLVYRSTDSVTFDLIATLPANTNAYADSDVTGLTYYYYYIAGKNAAGTGSPSNAIHIRAGNNAPVINSLTDIFVKVNGTATRSFTVTDDAGDIITVSVLNKPSFITLQSQGNGNYTLTASPGGNDVGSYTLTVTATDNSGRSSSKNVIVAVGDKNTKSVYVNFGSNTKTAPSPWNNWTGVRAAGDVISDLKDESNISTSISLTTTNAWSSTNDLGHITGANAGAFPDAVLASGLADSLLSVKQIKIGGLNTSRQYNIVLVGSRNEGITASADYSAAGQTSSLNSRYNTDQTANLNNLVPDANGQITVTITRTGSSPFTYLNGLAIEEVDQSVSILNPDNIYAAATNRTTVKLNWSDRTNNEASADGYELNRATDSLFTKNVQTISLPANTTAYTNTGLTPNTKYWYRVRAKNGANYSEYSKRVKSITPETIVYVNFNTTVAGAGSPWNNLESAPMFNFTTPDLKDHANKTTDISLTLEREFNGEFTSGVITGDNSGIVPDNVLRSDYWVDRNQIARFRLNGLNHSKRYRIGFIGSSSPLQWFKGNYTATYSIYGRKVYLNSWENSTKIVYIGDVAPDQDGKLTLDFSTTPEAGYGFNAGMIIEEYNDVAVLVPPDTTVQPPVDTIPNNPNPPVDTIPNNPNLPVDTIPNNPNPPVDTIPNNPNPPVDTIPNNPNPPVDTIPNNPNPPVDTIPNNPNPPDTIIVTPPVDSIPEPYAKVSIYPNPVQNLFSVAFFNKLATDKIGIEIYDPSGRITFRRDYGTRPVGTATILITALEANLRTGLYIITLKINGRIVRSEKLVRIRY